LVTNWIVQACLDALILEASR